MKTDLVFQTKFKECLTQLIGQSLDRCDYRFVIGVSAGIDSMVLLDLVTRLVPPRQVSIVYFDHRVRKNTQLDKDLVWAEGKKRGITHFLEGQRRGNKISELDLRIERHAFFEQALKRTQSDFLLLGHQANDQVETVLMRFIRGTGPDGLAGIAKRQGRILRPLLSFGKKEIENYARIHKIKFLEDESNYSSLYFRNRIRHQLLPLLLEISKDFGGEEELVARVAHLTEELQRLKAKRKSWCEKWTACYLSRTAFWWSFPILEWDKLDEDEQRLLARYLWKSLTHDSLEFREIEQFKSNIAEKKSVTLSGKVQVRISCGSVFLITQNHLRKQESIQQNIWEVCCAPQNVSSVKKKLQNWGAELRYLLPGDKYENKKMKKIISELKIERPKRPLIPVVAKRGTHQILWYFSLSGEMSRWIEAPWEKRF